MALDVGDFSNGPFPLLEHGRRQQSWLVRSNRSGFGTSSAALMRHSSSVLKGRGQQLRAYGIADVSPLISVPQWHQPVRVSGTIMAGVVLLSASQLFVW